MALEFGIFDHLERRPDVPLDRQYEERLELIAAADQAGFYAYHLAEHHQSPLCMAPSQNVFLASAAQRTRRLRIGSLVYLLPFYHPVRLVEEICMLDNLSGGRLQVGVGRGISALEHQFWGYDADQARERFEEALDVLVQGLTNDRLSYEGRHYRFDDLPMELSPKQTPYPPFWYAGNVEFAARHGMNFIGNAGVKRLPEVVARYRELWQDGRDGAGRINPHVLEPKIGSARHLFVADTDEQAEAVARRAWHAYHRNFPKRGYETPAPPGAGPSLGGDFDLACRVEAVIAGSPDTMRRYLDRYTAGSDANYFVGAFQWGDLTHAEALRSLTLFTSDVMPQFGGSQEPAVGSR